MRFREIATVMLLVVSLLSTADAQAVIGSTQHDTGTRPEHRRYQPESHACLLGAYVCES